MPVTAAPLFVQREPILVPGTLKFHVNDNIKTGPTEDGSTWISFVSPDLYHHTVGLVEPPQPGQFLARRFVEGPCRYADTRLASGDVGLTSWAKLLWLMKQPREEGYLFYNGSNVFEASSLIATSVVVNLFQGNPEVPGWYIDLGDRGELGDSVLFSALPVTGF